jgi:hypothetical protein
LIRESNYATVSWIQQVLDADNPNVNELTLVMFCDEKLRESGFDDQTFKLIANAHRNFMLLNESGDPNAALKSAILLSSKMKNVDAMDGYRSLAAEFRELSVYLQTLKTVHDRVLILEQLSLMMKRLVKLQRQQCENYFDRVRVNIHSRKEMGV